VTLANSHCLRVFTQRQSDAESSTLPLLPSRKQAGGRRPSITIQFLTHSIGKDNQYYITRGDKQSHKHMDIEISGLSSLRGLLGE
jgi:hypothetical protein